MRKVVILAIVLSILIVGADIARTVWMGDGEPPSETFTALTEAPARTLDPPKSNSYFLLLGFASAPSADPIQAGYDMWLEAESNRGHRLFHYEKDERSQSQVEEETIQMLQAWDAQDPIGQFRTLEASLHHATTQHIALLDRYQKWLTMPFEDWGYGHPGSPRFADLFAIHRLYVAEGFTQNIPTGMDRLQKDLRAWRTVMGKANTLTMKIAAVSMMDDDLQLLSEWLGRPDFDQTLLSPAGELALPLSHAERSMRWPLQHEFVIGVARYQRPFTGDDGARQQEADINATWIAERAGLGSDAFQQIALPAPSSTLSRAPGLRNKTLNIYANYYEATIRAAETPNRPLPRLQDFARVSHRKFLDYFLNPIDNYFTSGPEPDCKPFIDRVTETDARLRLAALQVRLRRLSRTQDILSRVVQMGTGFYDPFTGIPMLWNPATERLYSVGPDGKDDGGDTKLDISVPLFGHTPAVSLGPPRSSGTLG
jgi:hypothetical protein